MPTINKVGLVKPTYKLLLQNVTFFLDLGNYKSSSNLIGMLVIVFKKELLMKVVRHQVSQVKKYKGI